MCHGVFIVFFWSWVWRWNLYSVSDLQMLCSAAPDWMISWISTTPFHAPHEPQQRQGNRWHAGHPPFCAAQDNTSSYTKPKGHLTREETSDLNTSSREEQISSHQHLPCFSKTTRMFLLAKEHSDLTRVSRDLEEILTSDNIPQTATKHHISEFKGTVHLKTLSNVYECSSSGDNFDLIPSHSLQQHYKHKHQL